MSWCRQEEEEVLQDTLATGVGVAAAMSLCLRGTEGGSPGRSSSTRTWSRVEVG